MSLTILAQITAIDNRHTELRTALEDLIEPTLVEPGCLLYDLHVDTTNPGFFVFYEAWETRDQWLAHNNAPHLAAFRTLTMGMVARTEVHELIKIA